jgi:lycopene cyclase domain-containing protein
VRDYTFWAGVAVVATVAVEVLWFRTGIFSTATFWISYGIIVFFQILVDGWLTKLSAPIVLYNEAETTGWRFPWDIPVEDYMFGFALVTLPILLWVRAGSRPDDAAEPASEQGGAGPNRPQ